LSPYLQLSKTPDSYDLIGLAQMEIDTGPFSTKAASKTSLSFKGSL